MNLESENELVECLLCNRKFKIITALHLKKNHDTTMKEYRLTFPNAPISSEGFKQKQRQRTKVKETEQINTQEIKSEIPPDLTKTGKEEIFDYMRDVFFPRLKKGRVVKESPSGAVEYSLILDMFDFHQKIAFNFKDAYWHSFDNAYELNKVNILIKNGWKVYEIDGVNPTIQDVINSIEK